jgi:hypothetical protein
MDNERQLTFKWIYAAIAVALVLITVFAVAFAVQEHNDRVLSEEITETASELQETGARITSIRDADMKDMNDYVRPFLEMGLCWMPMIANCRRSLTCTTKAASETKAFSGSTDSTASHISRTGRA